MRRIVTTVLVATALTWALPQAAHAGGIKCWTNRDGVRECGNVVPPEYAQQGHEEKNALGMTVNRVRRAKTAEELAAEEKERKLQEEVARLAQEREKQDRILLETFSNADEIEMTRDGKIAIIQTEIKIAQRNIDIATDNLRRLRESAARSERRGKPVSEELRGDIQSAKAQLQQYQRFIAQKRAEQKEIRNSYNSDLKRFLDLTSGTTKRSKHAATQ